MSYNVYTDDVQLQRPWALDLLPLLITPGDWAHIETGVLQRVRVLEAVMADVYGERRLPLRTRLFLDLLQESIGSPPVWAREGP